MKKNIFLFLILTFIIALSSPSFAQLKKDTGNPTISGILNSPRNDLLLGFIDPSKIQMHHSLSMSYSSFGGQGIMMNSYLNTINYQLSDNLFLQTNIGLLSSPYHTFGENSALNDPKLFGGAKLRYNINDNSSIQLQFDYAPYYYYQPSLGSYRFNEFE
jgi:hypothetical protein